MPHKHAAIMAIDEAVDHVRGSSAGRLIIEYGDYECPYSRQAFREIERVEKQLGDGVRFAFRHFPLTEIHPHALDAALAAEAASLQLRFWNMHELLYDHHKALEEDDLRGYAAELELDVARFDSDRTGPDQMSAICAHTNSITLTELPDVIADREDCLTMNRTWCLCAYVSPAAALHAATARPIGTPRPTPAARRTRSRGSLLRPGP